MKKLKERETSPDDGILLTCRSVLGGRVYLHNGTIVHIKERHPEVLHLADLQTEVKRTVEEPEFIAKGHTDEVVAV
jgi:hypothetical protein